MALYKVNSGDLPMASDIDQLVDIFNGSHSIGGINLAQTFSSPSGALGVSLGNAGVASLGVGNYQYAVTFVTGYKKSNGTLVITNETPIGTVTNVTTTTTQQSVNLSSLPPVPVGVIARNLYRTKLGGSVFYLVATLTDGTITSYTDITTDANLGSQTPPTTNTTGTYFKTLSASSDGLTYSFKVDGSGNTTLLNLIVNGAIPTFSFDAGRTNKSKFYWNANGSNDFGMVFNVDGMDAMTLKKSGSAGAATIYDGATWQPVLTQGNVPDPTFQTKDTVSSFHVYRSNAMSGAITSSTWTSVNFDSLSWDNQTEVSNGVFTAKKDGLYHFCYGLRVQTTATTPLVGNLHSSSGVDYYSSGVTTVTGSNVDELAGSALFKLTAGQTVTLQIFAGASGASLDSTYPGYCWFSATRLQ